MEPIAERRGELRRRLLCSRAETPAASKGNTGMPSQQESEIRASSSLHGIDLVQVGGAVVAVNGDDQRQPDCGFRRGDRNGENDEQTPVRASGCGPNRQKAMKFRLAALSMSSMPTRTMMALRRDQRAGQPNGKQQRGKNQIGRQAESWLAVLFPHGNDHRTNRRSGQKQRQDFQRQNVSRHKQRPRSAGRPLSLLTSGFGTRGLPGRTEQHDGNQAAENQGGHSQANPPATPGRGWPADVGSLPRVSRMANTIRIATAPT